MGVLQLWSQFDHGITISSLEDEAWRYYHASPFKALRLGVDVSIWLKSASVGTPQFDSHASMVTQFNRLVSMFSLPILPVFVFDGPQRPSNKRGRYTSNYGSHKDTQDLKELIRVFGFIEYTAPGEAEAELAQLNAHNLIDAVLTDDSDAFLFGAKRVLRNTSEKLSGTKALRTRLFSRALSDSAQGTVRAKGRLEATGRALKDKYLFCYTSRSAITQQTQTGKQGPQGWAIDSDSESEVSETSDLEAEDDKLSLDIDRDALIFTACMHGGDYDLKGIEGCGLEICKVLASLGFATRLVKALQKCIQCDARSTPSYHDPPWMPRMTFDDAKWRKERAAIVEEMCAELESNDAGLMARRAAKSTVARIRADFMTSKEDIAVMAVYLWPHTTIHSIKCGSRGAEFELDWTRSGDFTYLLDGSFDLEKVGPQDASLKPARGPSSSADLVRLLVLFRKKFKWSDNAIRQKAQSMLSLGVEVRRTRREVLLQELGGDGNALAGLHERVTAARVGGLYGGGVGGSASSATGMHPSTSGTHSARVKGVKVKPLMRLEGITHERTVNGRLEYRVPVDESRLDALVQDLLERLDMPAPVASAPSSPSKQSPIKLTQMLDDADSQDTLYSELEGLGSKRSEPKFKARRSLWLPQELLRATSEGVKLISDWKDKIAQKEAALQAKSPKPSRSFSRSSSANSATSSSRQSTLFEFASPSPSIIKASPSRRKTSAGTTKKSGNSINDSDSSDDDLASLLLGTSRKSQAGSPHKAARGTLQKKQAPSVDMSPIKSKVLGMHFVDSSDEDTTITTAPLLSASSARKGKQRAMVRTSSSGSQKRPAASSGSEGRAAGNSTERASPRKAAKAALESDVIVLDDTPPARRVGPKPAQKTDMLPPRPPPRPKPADVLDLTGDD